MTIALVTGSYRGLVVPLGPVHTRKIRPEFEFFYMIATDSTDKRSTTGGFKP
jgi:hypothetical protein